MNIRSHQSSTLEGASSLSNVNHLISYSLKKQLLKHSNTSECSHIDFTEGEREKGLKTIIQHMIHVYGYEDTKQAVLNTFLTQTSLKNINQGYM